MARYYLAFPDYHPVVLTPGQPTPIGGTWRPAKYTDAAGQVHQGLACEQAGSKFMGRRLRGFRFADDGLLVDVYASAVMWAGPGGGGMTSPDLSSVPTAVLYAELRRRGWNPGRKAKLTTCPKCAAVVTARELRRRCQDHNLPGK